MKTYNCECCMCKVMNVCNDDFVNLAIKMTITSFLDTKLKNHHHMICAHVLYMCEFMCYGNKYDLACV